MTAARDQAPPRLLRLARVAELLDCSVKTVKRRAREAGVELQYVGPRSPRIAEEDVRRLLQRRTGPVDLRALAARTLR